jgi:hypothetical protein
MAALKRISARALLDLSQDFLKENLHGPFKLVFDDGHEIVTNARETLLSGYGWEYHREYRETPLLYRHHVQHVLAGGMLDADTHLKLLSICMWSVYDEYVLPNYKARMLVANTATEQLEMQVVDEVELRELLFKRAYELTNLIYNELSEHCEEYVVSLNILDFMEVLAHPKVREINNTLQPNPASINNAYKVVKDTLRNAPELQRNPLAKAVHSRTVKEDQLMQCLTARGTLTDVDSYVFRPPVLRGYARGFRKVYEAMVESRSAAKSLASSKAQLQDAEYFSRRLQLVDQVVQNLHMADCGTTEYAEWYVRGEEKEAGRTKRKADLKKLVGLYYLTEQGELRTIKETDSHLIGKKIKLRTVLGCAHPDPYGVCSTCFGDHSLSVPRGSNLGHMCCTHMTQKSSQSVLSLKHLDMSSDVDGVIIDSFMRKFVRASEDESSYVLAPELKQADAVKLIVSPTQARNLTDIRNVDEVEKLALTHVSEMESITIELTTQGGKHEEPHVVPVRMANRNASMTHELLDYIKMFGWATDTATGNYVIDMTNWDWSFPFLTLPPKHFNMSDHSAAIAKMLESTVKDVDERDSQTDPVEFLKEFHDLVNDKLDVPLAVNAVIVLGVTIRSAKDFDYRLPKPGTAVGLGVRSNIMDYRSASAKFAFQGHRDFLRNPAMYLKGVNKNRPNHPMDGVITPQEVLQAERNRKGWVTN